MEHEEGQCPGCGTAWVGNSGFAPVEGTFPSRNATACAVHRAAPELLEALEFEQQISLSGDAEAYPQFVEMRDAAIKAAKGD